MLFNLSVSVSVSVFFLHCMKQNQLRFEKIKDCRLRDSKVSYLSVQCHSSHHVILTRSYILHKIPRWYNMDWRNGDDDPFKIFHFPYQQTYFLSRDSLVCHQSAGASRKAKFPRRNWWSCSLCRSKAAVEWEKTMNSKLCKILCNNMREAHHRCMEWFHTPL